MIRFINFLGLVFIVLFFQVNFLFASPPDSPLYPQCQRQVISDRDIYDASPEFSWVFRDRDYEDYFQGAYRILVASTEKKMDSDEGDMWDSGKIESKETEAQYKG